MKNFFTALVSAICLTVAAAGWSAEPAKARVTQSHTFTRAHGKSEIRKAVADEVSIIPTQGNVQSLKAFTVTFSSAESVTRGNVGYGNAPTVHRTGDPAADKQFCFDMSFEGNAMTLSVNNEITAEGNWTLTLPAGFYLIDGVESTEPLEFNYTIVEDGSNEVSIVPMQGKVQSLKAFTVTFSNAESVTRGNVGYGNAPTVHRTGDPAADKQFCFDMSFEGNAMTLSVNNEITAEGNWTLTLPAGFYLVDGVESTEPLEFNYTLAPVIVEDGKIIYEAPAGKKVECMTRVLGWAVINNELMGGEFAGKPMHYVLTDDDCIYVYNPIVLSPFTGEQMNSYIKGVKDGDDYLFTFPQPIYEQIVAGETKTWYANKLRKEINDEGHSDYVSDETNTVRMRVNEDGSLECSQAWEKQTDLLGVLVDGKWNGFGGNRLLYRVMNFVVSEPPADLETEDAELEYADAEGNPASAFLKYGIVDNDIWIKGFGIDVLPEAWIHGVIDGENITFDQYMGQSDRYGQYVFLCGCGYDESLKLYPTEFAFDKDKMIITGTTNLCLNANNEFRYAFEEFQHCTVKLGSEDSDLTSRIPAIPVAVINFELIDAEKGQYDMAFEISNLNVDGQPLPEKRLSFQIILSNEEVYVFQPYRYVGISKSLTEIPFNSEYSFITVENNKRMLTLYDIKDNSDIGVRMMYKDATGTYYSDICWYKKSGIQTIMDTSDEVIETEWFDMSGRRVVNPSEGIYIRCERHLNGSKTVSKVNVKKQ